MTNFICLVWFSVRVPCHKELRFTPRGTKKILVPLGSCCASSREESFHRQFSAGSAAVTGRIRDLHPLSEEPAVGSQAHRGCAFSSRQVGVWAKTAASQKVTDWLKLRIMTCCTDQPREKCERFISVPSSQTVRILLLLHSCESRRSLVLHVEGFSFSHGKRRSMNFHFKSLDNSSPVRTVPFRKPYIRTLKNPIF